MKVKSKTSKGNILCDKKLDKKLNESKCIKSVSKKSDAEIRKNLESTIKLLQYRLNIKK